MKLAQIFEASEEDQHKFRQWQKECRAEAEECQFTGSCEGGCQAVDWSSPNNRVVGDWDRKTKSGQVYKK